MDGSAFDRLTRAFVSSGTRRGLLGVLTALPLVGILTADRDEPTEAAGRRRRRKKRHKHQRGDGKNNRKGKHKGKDNGNDKGQPQPPAPEPPPSPTCIPQPQTTTCAGQCATVTNNCDEPVDCGPCACTPPCPQCQRCDATTRQCQHEADGTACDDGNSCTQTDTCQSGTCIGGNLKGCPASDQCHDTGSCDPATGQCSDPPKPDGSACDDGNACTRTDTCQSGVCVGSDPVTCTPLGSCQTSDCDPATGQCVVGNKPNGTACDDGNSCTEHDACQDGACAGTPIVCTASDQCHDAGTCNPATGQCSDPAKPDSTACNDDDSLCTQNDTCQAGICTPGTPVVCSAADQCHQAGTCNPATGQCDNPAAPDGTACDDGQACTTSSCQRGVCTGTPVSCTQPPVCRTTSGATCDPATGTCSYPTVAQDGTGCGNGQVCCGGECVAGTCCTNAQCAATPTPICQHNTCVCTESSQCGRDQICLLDGSCHACDVICPSGSSPESCGTTLQLAIFEGGTHYICPGTYRRLSAQFFTSKAVSLFGAGDGTDPASNTILDPNGTGQVLRISNREGAVVLQRLRLTGGAVSNTRGAAIQHSGPMLQMTECTVAGNTATDGDGGGLDVGSSSTLEMTRCTVQGNHATGTGSGGGIYTSGTTTLTDCLIEANSAGLFGGGIEVSDGTTRLNGTTTVQGNHADADLFSTGGGIDVSGTLTVEETCRITRNTARLGSGGGIFNFGTVTLQGADPSPIVVDNCRENCAGHPVSKCSTAPPAAPCP
jgi:Right handed beta helix region